MKAIIALGVTGCITKATEVTLKNDKGNTKYCYLSNDHTLTSIGAVSEYNKCLNEAGS